MNIFILNTGRCGSMSFIKACQHITNYTSAHESRIHLPGDQRLAYPADHIEADNRLSWFLGRLDRQYSDNAFYVHLKRDMNAVAESFAKRQEYGIMKAYREGIYLMEDDQQHLDIDSSKDFALDYIDTVESNIGCFLKDKTSKMEFNLENAKQDFRLFWDKISASGDLEKSLSEWDINYNASTA